MAATITFNIKDTCVTHSNITRIIGGSLSASVSPNKGTVSAPSSTTASLTDSSRNIPVQYTYNCGDDHGDQSVTITLRYTTSFGTANASTNYDYHCAEDCSTGFEEDKSSGSPTSFSWDWNEYGSSSSQSSSGWKGSKEYEYDNDDCHDSFGVTVACTSSTHSTFCLEGYGSLQSGPYNISSEDEITLSFYPSSSTNSSSTLTGTAIIYINGTDTEIGSIYLSQDGAPGPEYTLTISPTSLSWTYGDKSSKTITITSTKKFPDGDGFTTEGDEPSIDVFTDPDSHWDYDTTLTKLNDTTWQVTITPKTVGDTYTGKDYSGSIKIKNTTKNATATLSHTKQETPAGVTITVKTNANNVGTVKVQDDNNSSNSASSNTTSGNSITVTGGEPYSISATPATNYVFSHWQEDNNTSASRSGLSSLSNTTHTAVFETDTSSISYTFTIEPGSLTWDYNTDGAKSIKVTSYWEFASTKTGIEPTCSLNGSHWTKSSPTNVGTNQWSISFTPENKGNASSEITDTATFYQQRNGNATAASESAILTHKKLDDGYTFSLNTSTPSPWCADESVIGAMSHEFKINSSNGTTKIGWEVEVGSYDTNICTITAGTPNTTAGTQTVTVTPKTLGSGTTCTITLKQNTSGSTLTLTIQVPEWTPFINEV